MGSDPGPLTHPYQLTHCECGNPAFYLSRKPEAGQPIASADCITLEGIIPPAGAPIICGSCGEQVGQIDMCTQAISERETA